MKKGKRNERKIKFLARIEKEFGKGLAEFAEDNRGGIERLPTGISQIDWLTLGGLPLGKVSLFRGAEGGTKTTMAMIACARYLERFPDRLAVYIDAEEKYPEQFVKRLGIDGSRFVRAAPETAEETIDFMDYSLREKSVGILVLDSIAALLPKIEREESVSGNSVMTIKDGGGHTHILKISELYALWKSGNRNFLTRGYDKKTASFGWFLIKNIWRFPPKKRIFQIETKYGRMIEVTEDHSVFKIIPGKLRCINSRRHLYRRLSSLIEVTGKEIRTGDYLLLEDQCTHTEIEKTQILLTDLLNPHSGKWVDEIYVTGVPINIVRRGQRTCDPKGNWMHGQYGPYISLSWAKGAGVKFIGSEKLYSRGSQRWIRNAIPSIDLGWLIGFTVGDGVVRRRADIRLHVGNSQIRRVLGRLSHLTELGSITIRSKKRSGIAMHDVRITCQPLVRVFDNWFGKSRAHNKRLPTVVFDFDEAGRKAVLCGLLDSDGHRRIDGGKYKVAFTTTSEMLAWDFVELAKTLRIVCGMRVIEPKPGIQMISTTGQMFTARHRVFRVECSGWSLYGTANNPHYGSGRGHIETSDGLPVKVKKVKEVRSKEVFDLDVMGANSFVANGLLVHNSMEKQQQGQAARLVNKAIRKIVGAMRARRVAYRWSPTVILVNQERIKIGVMYGDPSTLPGGEGQKFASSLILKMRALSVKEDDRKEWGLPEEHPVVKVATTVVKHSFGPRGKGAEYMLAMAAIGNVKAGEAFDHEFVRILAMKRGLVGQNGRGSEKIAKEIAERGELYQKLKKEILEERLQR